MTVEENHRRFGAITEIQWSAALRQMLCEWLYLVKREMLWQANIQLYPWFIDTFEP